MLLFIYNYIYIETDIEIDHDLFVQLFITYQAPEVSQSAAATEVARAIRLSRWRPGFRWGSTWRVGGPSK